MKVGNREELEKQGYELMNDDPLDTLHEVEDFSNGILLTGIVDSVAVNMGRIGYDVYVKFGNGKN